MEKQRPTEFNKKIKRLQKSRDQAKTKNREKNLLNQKLRDRNIEIAESRDQWKDRHKALTRHNQEIEQQLQAVREDAERERLRANQERKRADNLQAEIDTIWKKKSGA